MGCRKIAEQISSAFGLEIDKDVVRRILIQHYRPAPGGDGPSWLTVIGQARDSLWSVDLFRCESILLRSFWVMVVMDVFTAGWPELRRLNAAAHLLLQPVCGELLILLRNEQFATDTA